jgi:hypothetical protein
MATKQEWREYFELVNGRKPSAQEFAAAKAAGEFGNEQAVKFESLAEPNLTSQQQGKEKRRWLLPSILGLGIILIVAVTLSFTFLRGSLESAYNFNGTYFSGNGGEYVEDTFKNNQERLIDFYIDSSGKINLFEVDYQVLNDGKSVLCTYHNSDGKDEANYQLATKKNTRILESKSKGYGTITEYVSSDRVTVDNGQTYYKEGTANAQATQAKFTEYASQIATLEKELK